MSLDPMIINNLIIGGIAWGASLLAALWLSLILWTYRDSRTRARNPLAHFVAVITVAVFFLPGMVIYLLLRPAHTLDEEYQRQLEEEALFQSIENPQVCPGCGRHIQLTWVVCPSCHTRLKKPCQQCHELMELAWNLCPYCGTPVPGMRLRDPQKDAANPSSASTQVIPTEGKHPATDQYAEFIHVVDKPEVNSPEK